MTNDEAVKYLLKELPGLNPGKNVTSKPPKTEIWCMLYAQVKQADGRRIRNILLSEVKLQYVEPERQFEIPLGRFLVGSELPLKISNSFQLNLDAPSTATGKWKDNEIQQLLDRFNLNSDTRLSVLAVEMMPRYDQYIIFGKPSEEFIHPLSQELGSYRILRTSPLVAAPEIC